NSQTSHDPRDWIPGHLDQLRRSCRLGRHGARFLRRSGPEASRGRGIAASRLAFGRASPFGLTVHRSLRDAAQGMDGLAIDFHGPRGELGPRRFIHEGHEFIGEAGHRAADAYAADVRTSTDAAHPAALGNVALHYWSPAAELD